MAAMKEENHFTEIILPLHHFYHQLDGERNAITMHTQYYCVYVIGFDVISFLLMAMSFSKYTILFST